MNTTVKLFGIIVFLCLVLVFIISMAPEAWAESTELYSVQNMKLTHKSGGKDRVLKDLFKAYPYFTQAKWYDLVRSDGTHLIGFIGILDTSDVSDQVEKSFGQLVNEVRWGFEYPFSQKLDPQNVMSALAALKIVPKSYYIIVLQDGNKKKKHTNAKGELLRIFHNRPISFYEEFGIRKPTPLPEGGLDMEMPMK